ncbi:murein biosynthesis integral membrane protein MurJ [Inhella gelatinilytica]|uniref:Probable lipid II flippase MurJ n=1 Tax=Inhella gelatinilytica TaxID=2795030 RepID=A0A931IU80_9BURK|nr:murein biosynthesis integral membrane protein MurJ [Inhella gelatinilytica]MBH9552835.1 murein biosynthesis integral membrane protein MurJ [Inhella gelatinilytica]
MNLLRAAGLVSALTLLSRVTGLVREQVVTALFGATALTDAFQVAFRIPNMFRRLFAEGAFSQAFVPTLAAQRSTEGDEATRSLVDATATVLLLSLMLVCLLGIAGAPVLVWLMGGGLNPQAHSAAVDMTRWMFPYIACMSLVALSAGVLNTWRHFAVAAATPVLLNLSVIAAAWGLSTPMAQWGWPPIYSLAAGVMLGGVVQLAVQVPALRRIGMLPRVSLSLSGGLNAWRHPGVKRILALMAPALLGVGVAQVSLMINTHIATTVAEGAATWVSLADRLMEFPIALAGVALGVVLTPLLAAAKTDERGNEFSSLLDWGLRLVWLLGVPCAVALLVFALPLVSVLYQYGKFTPTDALQTAHAVQGYGVGLIGLLAIKILAPGYFARHDTRTPVKVAVVVLVFTQVMNLIWVPVFGAAGLALSIGLGALLNAGWLAWGLRRSGVYQPGAGWLGFAVKSLLAAALMGMFLWGLASELNWLTLHKGWRVALMGASMVGAMLIYFGSLWGLRIPLRQLVRRA